MDSLWLNLFSLYALKYKKKRPEKKKTKTVKTTIK